MNESGESLGLGKPSEVTVRAVAEGSVTPREAKASPRQRSVWLGSSVGRAPWVQPNKRPGEGEVAGSTPARATIIFGLALP